VCDILEISQRTIERWRKAPGIGDLRRGPNTKPNAYSEQERAQILERINQEDYVDMCPAQIVCHETDKGNYLASESTMYRILNDAKQNKKRGRAAAPKPRPKPELVAHQPNKVWVWDITYLPLHTRGKHVYLYWVMDLFSRKIVGFKVCEVESMDESSQMIEKLVVGMGLVESGLILHSDNGGPMKGSTMKWTLDKLKVHQSLSRPGVSNDNAHCESSFHTLKYRPGYPCSMEDLEQWNAWVTQFVKWYNEEHMHSGIGYVTAQQRYEGTDVEVLRRRRQVYAQARAGNPKRWSGAPRLWPRPDSVRLGT